MPLMLQATEAQDKGRNAMYKWRPVFEHPHLHISVKLEALRSYLLPAVTYSMAIWPPPVPRQRGRVDAPTPPLIPVSKTLNHCSVGPYTICGLRGRNGAWQDRACSASAILHRDTAVYPWLLKLAHLRLLRQVMRRVDNADDAHLRNPLVAAFHSTCQALHPPLGSPSALLSATPVRTSLLSPATGSSAPRSMPRLASGLRICLDLQYRLFSPLGMVAPPGPGALAGIITYWMRLCTHLQRS
jgi:hypothetical protein